MKLYVVGLGPGGRDELTPRALRAIEDSQVVVGYHRYLDQVRDLVEGKITVSTGMRGEENRCRSAVRHALEGRTVSVVCGGDPGVYGMAGLLHELAREHGGLPVEVVPGVTAATAASAVLGAPIGHDFAVVSLSDLLTDWETIEKRLKAAAWGDYVLCIYNPASNTRRDHLRRACEILLAEKRPDTPCGIVRDAGREGQAHKIVTLEQLRDEVVDMSTTVIVGNSETEVIGGRLVTPRGYHRRGKA